MRCQDVIELLSEYWDIPAQDERRQAVDAHIVDCSACREEFEMWKQSAELIQSTRFIVYPAVADRPITTDVMNRIYKDESWRIPVSHRSYTFSYKVRRNIMAVFAMCLSIFIVAFVFSFVTGGTEADDFTELTGIIDTARAEGPEIVNQPAMFDGIPLASISAPTVLKMGPIQSYTDYLLAVSILGFVFILLIMNWLSRLRA